MGVRCDFCGSPDAQWTFPARNFVHERDLVVGGLTPAGQIVVTDMQFAEGYAGSWLACPGCHALIARGDRRRLARRCAKRIQKSPEGSDMPLGVILSLVRRLQDDFWANREGPATRLVKEVSCTSIILPR